MPNADHCLHSCWGLVREADDSARQPRSVEKLKARLAKAGLPCESDVLVSARLPDLYGMSEEKRSGTEKAQSIRLLVNGSSWGVSEFMEETTGPLVGRGGGGDAGGDVGGDGIVRTLCDLSRSALLLHFKRRVCGDIDEEGGSLMSRSDQALHPAAPLEARVAHATTQREVLNRCVQPPASPTAATICARAHRPPPALLLHHHHHPVFLTSGLYLRCASQAG